LKPLDLNPPNREESAFCTDFVAVLLELPGVDVAPGGKPHVDAVMSSKNGPQPSGTCVGVHTEPPRAVGISLSVKARAIAPRDVMPSDRKRSMIRAISAARRAAASFLTFRTAALSSLLIL
jgi:hypothetical protein